MLGTRCVDQAGVGTSGQLTSLDSAESVLRAVDRFKSHLWQRVARGLSLQTVWG